MKRILATLLAVMLLASLALCTQVSAEEVLISTFPNVEYSEEEVLYSEEATANAEDWEEYCYMIPAQTYSESVPEQTYSESVEEYVHIIGEDELEGVIVEEARPVYGYQFDEGTLAAPESATGDMFSPVLLILIILVVILGALVVLLAIILIVVAVVIVIKKKKGQKAPEVQKTEKPQEAQENQNAIN